MPYSAQTGEAANHASALIMRERNASLGRSAESRCAGHGQLTSLLAQRTLLRPLVERVCAMRSGDQESNRAAAGALLELTSTLLFHEIHETSVYHLRLQQ